jgi:succinate-acetate transporter protein
MKYAILGSGAMAAVLFIYSIYVFFATPENFKSVAYGFLGLAILFFVLIIFRKIKEDRELREKIEKGIKE